MKSVATIICLLFIGIAASAWAQGASVDKGKAIVDSKHCALCHKQGGVGKPIETLVGTNTDAFLKGAITDPKKTLGPQVPMPAFALTNEQVQDVIGYLRSVAKH
jgi:mono/diheme cytochrome c family protein